MKRPLAYITAPWGENEFENTENAARWCRLVYDAGFSPVCPLLFLPLFLKDSIPQEHKDGLDMARDYLRRSRVLVVCGGKVDETVKNDIATAERLRITATTLDGILTVKGRAPPDPSYCFDPTTTSRKGGRLPMKTKHTWFRSLLAGCLAVVMLISLMPTAFAGQEDGYHDPAEHWQEALNRTNELDANSVVTIETFHCCVCDQDTSFRVFRVPEYTRDGGTALTRNVKYSDGTCLDGESKGDLLDGTPGKDAYYTGYHWTKAVCETCGTFNTNMGATNYSCDKNIYWLYDCAANFFEELPETQTIEKVDSGYHRVTTTRGSYCGFCYGTFKEESSTLERHHMDSAIRPELAHDRFVEMDTCEDCGYSETAYTAAKSVVADYFGVVDGQPHTVTVSDLSDAGVTTAIRYGNEANSCTLTSAPNYTEAGDYPVYYEITYTYHDTDMVEDGVAFVHLLRLRQSRLWVPGPGLWRLLL